MSFGKYVLLVLCIWTITNCDSALQTINTQLHLQILKGTGVRNISEAYLPPRSANKIALIQNEVKRLKYQMEKLKSSTNLANDDISQITNLESIIEFTSTLLDNQDRDLTEMISTFQKSIEDLITEIVLLTKAQEETYKQLVEQQEENRRKSLLTDVIVDIRSNDFKSASEKINLIKNDQKIQFIVKELYRNQEGNFNLIRTFAKSIKDISKSLPILRALYDEMLTNGHRNLEKFILLADTVKGTTTRQEGVDLVKGINNAIENDAKQLIRSDILSGSNKPSDAIEKLIQKLDNYEDDICYNIFLGVINDLYKRIGVGQIITYFSRQPNPSYNRRGFNALYDEIVRRNQLNSEAIVLLAVGLKDAIKRETIYVDDEYEKLKNKLPECIRNAVFHPIVCIKSVHFTEYFYAADGFNYDNDRRRVFTWMPGGKDNVKSEFWSFEASDGNFYIKNVGYNEYLYAAVDEFNLDKSRRRVFTWIVGGHTVKGSEYWHIEPRGNNCFIKNIVFDEYLFPIDGMHYDDKRRELATWIPKGCDDNCLWKIEKCG